MRFTRFTMLGLLAFLAACATPPPVTDRDALAEFNANNDPAEPFNRVVFAVNQGLDTVLVRPATMAYRTLVPSPARTGLRNALRNIRTPVILLNDMLQGQPQHAGNTLGRFVVNTTLGLGGLIDVADWYWGVPFHNEDFGQTLASWGVGEGPYLVLPLLGPSNPRDTLGFAVDIASQPLTWLGSGFEVNLLSGLRTGLGLLDAREAVQDTLDEVNRTSLDPYATLRSGYRQGRNAAIANRDRGARPAR